MRQRNSPVIYAAVLFGRRFLSSAGNDKAAECQRAWGWDCGSTGKVNQLNKKAWLPRGSMLLIWLYQLFLSCFSTFSSAISRVCHPRVAHLTRTGIWEMSFRVMAASSSSSWESSVTLPRIMSRKRRQRRRPSSTVLPWRSSAIMAVEAWLIAQPVPV